MVSRFPSGPATAHRVSAASVQIHSRTSPVASVRRKLTTAPPTRASGGVSVEAAPWSRSSTSWMAALSVTAFFSASAGTM